MDIESRCPAIEQKLAGGEIIGRAPICVQRGQLLLDCRATGFNVHVMTS